MAKYLDIFTDYGFKKIFGEEANKNILIDFLNALLPESAQIKDLTFKNTERQGRTPNSGRPVYDIYCEGNNGEKFIVELQKSWQSNFIDRTIYYSSFPLNEQSPKGKKGYWLNAVYCISILDFTIKELMHDFDDDFEEAGEEAEVVHIFTLRDYKAREIYKKLAYIFIEMPHFNKGDHELETRLDKWFYFIKNLQDFQAIPEIFKNDVVFVEAIEKAEIARMSDTDRANYDADLKTYFDYAAVLESLKMEGIEIGKTEGIEIGIEIGIEEGIEIGEANKEKYAAEKAEVERKKTLIGIAKNCLAEGMNIEKIAKLTGLTEHEILAIGDEPGY